MSSHLSDQDIETIVGILDGWSGRLTWNTLIDAIEVNLGQGYTRQALSKHDRIKRAFTVRKRTLSKYSAIPSHRSLELQKALERIERLKAENARLRADTDDLRDQFARWAYNAFTKGITEEFLDKPLPPTDRDRTDD
jgi:hypothetical protein